MQAKAVFMLRASDIARFLSGRRSSPSRTKGHLQRNVVRLTYYRNRANRIIFSCAILLVIISHCVTLGFPECTYADWKFFGGSILLHFFILLLATDLFVSVEEDKANALPRVAIAVLLVCLNIVACSALYVLIWTFLWDIFALELRLQYALLSHVISALMQSCATLALTYYAWNVYQSCTFHRFLPENYKNSS